MENTHFETIAKARKRLGKRLAILGHHYLADSVIRHTDLQGDSLELSRAINGLEAEYVVFCGVYFMAESAAILAREGQKVFIPDARASCVMADAAPEAHLRGVLKALEGSGRRFAPLAYVNSSAAVKAVCGEFGGSVCTSANARTMMAWALKQGDGVIFLPDKNLGMNTAIDLGLDPKDIRHLDIRGLGARVDPAREGSARLLLWPGVCPIHHSAFKPEMVAEMRERNPGALVAVHPESTPEVVRASDGAGSTSYLIRYAADAPAGSTVVIGTETNLVQRLANRHAGKKIILPLHPSYCSNMAKITEAKLAAQLADIESLPPVTVSATIANAARLALQRMLDACA